MKLLNVEKQDNIEFYLSCKFQPSTFNVRCKTDVTDGMPDKQTNERTTDADAVAPPLGIIKEWYKFARGTAFARGARCAYMVAISSEWQCNSKLNCQSWLQSIRSADLHLQFGRDLTYTITVCSYQLCDMEEISNDLWSLTAYTSCAIMTGCATCDSSVLPVVFNILENWDKLWSSCACHVTHE